MLPRTVLIKGARVIDPLNGLDEVADILVSEGNIAAVGPVTPDMAPEGCLTIEAAGLVASPGFIDLHAHLREPGFEHKETIATGSRAAARGGFTAVCCMPNTEPAIDNAAVVDLIRRRSRDDAIVRIYPIGCVTKGRLGKELADMEELAAAGVVAFSDDGDPVYDPALMRMALVYSADLGLPVIDHCQDPALSGCGVMAEGWVATRLGLPGIPAAAEETMVARDLSLAELTGGRLHLAHLSAAGCLSMLHHAKEKGVTATAEVCPHHLTITDHWVLGNQDSRSLDSGPYSYDTDTKVYPPLRGREDITAMAHGLVNGVIDCIATDHAPHDLASKQVTYTDAAFGISCLETALGSVLTLVHSGQITLSSLVERLTVAPARVLGPSFTKFASLQHGTPADIVLFDPDAEWVVDSQKFESKGKNTPLHGVTLKGKVAATLVQGEVVFQDG